MIVSWNEQNQCMCIVLKKWYRETKPLDPFFPLYYFNGSFTFSLLRSVKFVKELVSDTLYVRTYRSMYNIV